MSYYNRNIIAQGGEIHHLDGWTVHTFRSSGNLFVESVGIASAGAEYLVVAGGGSGGYGDGPSSGDYPGAGGGAGGFRAGSNYAVSYNTSYTIIVGAGGVGSPHASSPFTMRGGVNSQFADIESFGGGAGYSGENTFHQRQYALGHSGGSAGGSSSRSGQGTSPVGNLPQVDPPQGNPGGRWFARGPLPGPQMPPNSSAGGGGAGGVGGNGPQSPSNGAAGPGGAGRSSNITGTVIFYAGGGGGAAPKSPTAPTARAPGGIGGGGAGSQANPPATPDALKAANSGVQFTGGGGGGNGHPGLAGGSGGSGIVIIRVPFLSPRYLISESANSIQNGANITFSVFATNIANNYIVNYRTSGAVVNLDFLEGNTGTITIVDNRANLLLTSNVLETKSFTLELFDSNFADNVVVTSNVVTIIKPIYMEATGGSITNSGGFRLHAFTTSGNLTIISAGSSPTIIQTLIVAGGGGGSGGPNYTFSGAGGGAGGLQDTQYEMPSSFTGNVVVVVGAAGDGGGQGSPSSIFNLTSTGGGTKSYPTSTSNSSPGGSGAGGQYNPGGSFSGAAGAGVPGQGFSGGPGGPPVAVFSSGGGGGAGQAGSAAIPDAAHNSGKTSSWGGNGLPVTWVTPAYGAAAVATGSNMALPGRWFAGGGGAGTTPQRNHGHGGHGGGGEGRSFPNPGVGNTGLQNTGGGGGGGRGGGNGGSGGSGIVIIRYPYE